MRVTGFVSSQHRGWAGGVLSRAGLCVLQTAGWALMAAWDTRATAPVCSLSLLTGPVREGKK